MCFFFHNSIVIDIKKKIYNFGLTLKIGSQLPLPFCKTSALSALNVPSLHVTMMRHRRLSVIIVIVFKLYIFIITNFSN